MADHRCSHFIDAATGDWMPIWSMGLTPADCEPARGSERITESVYAGRPAESGEDRSPATGDFAVIEEPKCHSEPAFSIHRWVPAASPIEHLRAIREPDRGRCIGRGAMVQ